MRSVKLSIDKNGWFPNYANSSNEKKKCRTGFCLDFYNTLYTIKWNNYCAECFVEDISDVHISIPAYDFISGTQSITTKYTCTCTNYMYAMV